MAGDDPNGKRPVGPVVLRIKLRYDDVETMVQRFAPNIGKSGLFLPTKSLQPVGAEVKFELRLSTEQPVLVGLGRVKTAKPPDPDDPKATFGMAVELMRVTRESRDLIMKMLARRKVMGLPELGIPQPSDIDAARRADFFPDAIKDPASSPVPVAIAPVESRPEVPPTEVKPTDRSESLLTAPRRTTGPLAVQKVAPVAPLAPEPPRRKRPGLGELIERASGPVAVAVDPELDANVDVAAVLARARLLAGGDLDAELDALRESSAAPIEISIEAASAELARQLGGAAVRRGWAPPPAVTESKPIEVPEVVAELRPSVPDVSVPDEPPVPVVPDVSVPDEPSVSVVPNVSVPDEPPVPVEPPVPDVPVPDDPPVTDEPLAALAPEPADTMTETPDELLTPVTPHERVPHPGFADEPEDEPAHEVEPEQIHDEIHQLGDSDYEEIENTAIGEQPLDPGVFDEHAFATRPSEESEAMAARLDAELAQAEARAEDDDWGFDEAKVDAPALAPEYQQDYVVRFDSQAEPPAELEMSEIQEIDDFEILAEADASDADLMAAHGEAEVTRSPVAAPDRPSLSDFAARLDLGDSESFSKVDSADAALASFDDIDDQPQTPYPGSFQPIYDQESYTDARAEPPPDLELQDHHASFPPLHQFDQSDVHDISGVPKARTHSRDERDLEHALQALDVDLDDLSIPHASTELARDSQSSRGRTSIRPPSRTQTPRPQPQRAPRASTDDGVMIDFDDFEDDQER